MCTVTNPRNILTTAWAGMLAVLLAMLQPDAAFINLGHSRAVGLSTIQSDTRFIEDKH
jgi:hypothetical protein